MDNLAGYKELIRFILNAKYIALKTYDSSIVNPDKPLLIRGGFSKRKYYICTCGKNSRIHLTKQTGIVEGLHWRCPKCGKDNIINNY